MNMDLWRIYFCWKRPAVACIMFGLKILLSTISRFHYDARYVVPNHRPFDRLFNSLCRPTSKKQLSQRHWRFLRGIHQWPVNSPHKGPVTRKKFHLMTSSYADCFLNCICVSKLVLVRKATILWRATVQHFCLQNYYDIAHEEINYQKLLKAGYQT